MIGSTLTSCFHSCVVVYRLGRTCSKKKKNGVSTPLICLLKNCLEPIAPHLPPQKAVSFLCTRAWCIFFSSLPVILMMGCCIF